MADLVPMFVYGTLRPGSYNAWYASDRVDRDCTVNGRIYFVSREGGYPVAKLDEEGTIHGDVIWLEDDSDDYAAICAMEEGAGYTSRWVEVVDSEGQSYEAWAWHYDYEPGGRWIESGDWRREHASL